MLPTRMPKYRELPVRKGAPPGSAWGVFGDDDEIGTLNLLTSERTVAAARLVQSGEVFPLNLPLHLPWRPEGARRGNPVHCMLHVGYEDRGFEPGPPDDPTSTFFDRDDYLERLWLQGSSQWDGLTHVRHPVYGNYNGIDDAEIHNGEGGRLGIDKWSERGVVGRGVLLDLQRYYESDGRPFEPESNNAITVEDLAATAERHGVELGEGDILLLHTGWLKHLVTADGDYRQRILTPGGMKVPGLESTPRMLEYLWDLHIAALASDLGTIERFPAPEAEEEWPMHRNWLPLLGMPLGEFWDLDRLARSCAADARYEFLLVSVPLNVRGGVGSPSQAVAIK